MGYLVDTEKPISIHTHDSPLPFLASFFLEISKKGSDCTQMEQILLFDSFKLKLQRLKRTKIIFMVHFTYFYHLISILKMLYFHIIIISYIYLVFITYIQTYPRISVLKKLTYRGIAVSVSISVSVSVSPYPCNLGCTLFACGFCVRYI